VDLSQSSSQNIGGGCNSLPQETSVAAAARAVCRKRHQRRHQQGLFATRSAVAARAVFSERSSAAVAAKAVCRKRHRRQRQQGLFAARDISGSSSKGCLPQEIIGGSS
jgi:hypothetical protein